MKLNSSNHGRRRLTVSHFTCSFPPTLTLLTLRPPPDPPDPAVLRRRELEAIKQLQQTQNALEQELIEANAAHGEEMRKLKHNQEVKLPC